VDTWEVFHQSEQVGVAVPAGQEICVVLLQVLQRRVLPDPRLSPRLSPMSLKLTTTARMRVVHCRSHVVETTCVSGVYPVEISNVPEMGRAGACVHWSMREEIW